MKALHKLFISAATIAGAVMMTGVTVSAREKPVLPAHVFNQKKTVLKANNEPNIINNDPFSFNGDFRYQNYGSSNGYYQNPLQNYGENISSNWLSGLTQPINFNTMSYLPTSFDHTGYLSAQALAISPDGNTAYEMGHYNGDNPNLGRVVKYNLGDLNNRFHTNQNGSMHWLRQAYKWELSGYSAPNCYRKAKRAYTKAKNRVKWFNKVRFKKKKWCKKHHRKFYSKRWVAGHNRYVKTRTAKQRLKKERKSLKKVRSHYRRENSKWSYQENMMKGILPDVQVGPIFRTGHAQSLAVKPDGSLWYMNYQSTDGNDSFVDQIDTNNLAPMNQTNLTRIQDNDSNDDKPMTAPALGHSFAFDKDGNAWFWVYQNQDPGNVDQNRGEPGGTVLFYKGQMKPGKVVFKQQKNALANGPGYYQQSCGFNRNTGKFFLVSDGSMISVPANKLASDMTDSDVFAFHLNGGRESEGLSFNQWGTAYFLVNRGPEIFTSNDLNY